MNKTIYIRDEDVPVWERARELAGDKLAPIIVDGLRNFIAAKEHEAAEAKGFERIELKFHDGDAYGLVKKRAFYGKWIFPIKKPLESHSEEESHYCAVALTAKGATVIIYWSADRDGETYKRFRIYESLEAAAADPIVNWAAIKTTDKVGVPVEELDI